ncbi:sensor histidine kinase [Paenarthrobacter sp. JL.01a]|uniref:sensor histidine kinase n=1 Tax=Paenarthrobacter sp. JL.01a TaxID=2979324 RepID=UPI0021C6E2C3|nr:ATP-binding protein [Paenarthrobacter sp. JL.01a]UXM93609.1 ATP-binding protein [Paenarthrobacter sp. JL.01a]
MARFLTAGFVALVLLATPVIFWIRAEAEQHALANARDMTQRLADNVVGPLLTTELLAQERPALDLLHERLVPWLSTGTLTRIKVWDEQGKVVYSDMDSLIGQRFEQEEWARKLLEGGPATATLEAQTEQENLYESGAGELVEVYVRSRSVSGAPMIFETYSSGENVRREQHAVLMSMIPPMLLSLAALQLAQLFPAVRLARRIQRHQAAKHALLQYAIEASDQERRQVASELHDDVIQDLSGLAYALESEERRGPADLRPVFSNARLMLQNTVRTLRAMTNELYPPDLERLGLKASLTQLAAPLVARGITLTMELPEQLIADRDRAALMYRVVREALVNATKHSSATFVHVRIRQSDYFTKITVSDNGHGFEPNLESQEGHYGLRILGDTIQHAGGALDVRSSPGAGTIIRVTLAGPQKPGTSNGRASRWNRRNLAVDGGPGR